MNRDAFHQRIRNRARLRYGIDVSDRDLRFWGERKYFTPDRQGRGLGGGRGSNRSWGPDQYRRALKVVRLKSQRLTRDSSLIAALWLAGDWYPFDRVRKAAIAAFKPLARRMKGRADNPYDPRSMSAPTDLQARAINRYLGPVSSRLIPGFEYSRDARLAMHAQGRFGVAAKMAQKANEELKGHFAITGESDPIRLEALENAFRGLIGDEEIAGRAVAILKAANETHFRIGRKLLHQFRLEQRQARKLLQRFATVDSPFREQSTRMAASLEVAIQQLGYFEFRMLYFAAFVNLAFRKPDLARQFLAKLEKFNLGASQFVQTEFPAPARNSA